MTVCKKAQCEVGPRSSWASWPFSHPLPVLRSWETGLGIERIQRWQKQHSFCFLWLRAWHVGLVQGGGTGADEKQGRGPTDEHFCGWGLGDVSPLPADPDSSCSLGGVGICPPRSAVPSCPDAMAGTALGNGVRRRTSPSSAKACGILRPLGQRFSDVTKLRLGQEQAAGGGGGCHLD